MCVTPDDPRLAEFNDHRGIIGGVPILTDYLLETIEAQFPDLLDLISDPQRWVAGLPPWLAQGASRVEPRSIVIAAVEAPLTFGGAYLRLDCPAAGSTANLFVLNAAFMAMVRHVLASSQGDGLPDLEVWDLLQDLRRDATRLRRGPGGGGGFEAAAPGIAWLLAHELGHATGGAVIPPTAFDHLPDWCRADVLTELNADLTGLKLLCHRITATPHVGDAAVRLRALFDGVELMIRGLALLDSLATRRPRPLGSYGEILDSGAPSPALRWKTVADEKHAYEQLGLLGQPTGATDLFENWDPTVERIVSEGRRRDDQ